MIQSRSTQCAALHLKFGTLPISSIFIYNNTYKHTHTHTHTHRPSSETKYRDKIIVGGLDSLR